MSQVNLQLTMKDKAPEPASKNADFAIISDGADTQSSDECSDFAQDSAPPGPNKYDSKASQLEEAFNNV